MAPSEDEGVTIALTGTVKAVEPEGAGRIATVAVTAAVDGKTVLGRAVARVRIPV